MPNILIVEDEAHLVDGLTFNLEREGHEITVARDGISADRLLTDSSQTFDLVLLDLMLPGMGGFEVARRARAAGNFVPILILTAKDAQGDLIRGIDAGGNTKHVSYLPTLPCRGGLRKHARRRR